MRQTISLFFLAAIMACNNGPAKTPEAEAPKQPAASEQGRDSKSSPLKGNWVGFLGDNRLNVQIMAVSSNQVTGRSIAAGNFREITGAVEETADAYKLHLKEPGDDKYDGEFDIIIKKNGMICEGSWQPFDKTLKTKQFTLSKKEFVYKPDAGLFPEASQRLLKEDDVANYIKSELRLMRNSMYARHGYSFKMKDMRSEFDKQEWYIPMNTDVRTELTAIEKKNEVLIKRYEKYAAEFYDDFGR